MTAIELARQVREMRRAQQRYFRERNGENLDAARKLEKALDRTIDEILADRPPKLNMMGFDPE